MFITFFSHYTPCKLLPTINNEGLFLIFNHQFSNVTSIYFMSANFTSSNQFFALICIKRSFSNFKLTHLNHDYIYFVFIVFLFCCLLITFHIPYLAPSSSTLINQDINRLHTQLNYSPIFLAFLCHFILW